MTAIRHLAALGVALAALAFAAPAVLADAVITVNAIGDQAVNNDGLCTLREAIVASNTDTASGVVNGECVAGDAGWDTIVFTASGAVHLAADLPQITSQVRLNDGAGDPDRIVVGHDHRIFSVGPAASVNFYDLELRGGLAANGGAIEVQGVASLVSSRLIDNDATTAGGGLYVGGDGVLSVLETSIVANGAVTGAGIFVAAGGDLEVTQSAITNNIATGDGGGIATASKTVLANVTIARNMAVNGGAVSATGGTLAIYHATIVENSASATGGALAIGGGVTASTVGNSIVSDNFAPAGVDVQGAIGTSTANLVGVNTDELLDTVPDDNGGPTPTYRLLPTATAAIDAGNSDICNNGVVGARDQRDQSRNDAGCDIGAYERDSVDPVVDLGPVVALAEGTRLSGSKPSVVVEWDGHDDGGYGFVSYLLEGSINGGPWLEIGSSEEPSALVTVPLDAQVRFRVTPIDFDENVGTPAVSAPFRAKLVQQTSKDVRFKGTWRNASSSSFSGGSARRSTERSASAKLEFTGKGIAFVTTEADNRGIAKIYINGKLQASVDLSEPTRYRVLAWKRAWTNSATRTIKVVVSGTRRVDVDAFVVLK